MHNDYITVRQLRNDLQRQLDFCGTQLSRTLTHDEEIYYKSRKYCLTEILQTVRHMRDYNESPERSNIEDPTRNTKK